jgi:hypothetical protein
VKEKTRLYKVIMKLFRLFWVLAITGGIVVLTGFFLDVPAIWQEQRNDAWTALVEKPNDEIKQVADDLDFLLLGTGTAEERFVSILRLYKVHYEYSQPYDWYWLALSGNESETSQATRNLLFNDLSFADRFTSLKTLIINPNRTSTNSQLRMFIDIYFSDQDKLESVLVDKIDVKQLMVEVEHNWVWLECLGWWVLGSAAFLLVLELIFSLILTGTIPLILGNINSFFGWLSGRKELKSKTDKTKDR